VLVAIALGGAVGAAARYGAGLALPVEPGSFPWATLLVNASGCLAIGVLLVLVAEGVAAHPLARPFLGVGALGGYTTFSTYAVEADALLRAGERATALAYLGGTLVAALLAVRLGTGTGTALARAAQRRR
jgi:CrcB protein